MIRKLLSLISGKPRGGEPSESLPAGLEAAPPIDNPKLRQLLDGPDITTSGGVHLVAEGRPLASGQRAHSR